MNFKGIKYEFTSQPWQSVGKGAWTFVTMPQEVSKEIRNQFKSEEEGWGRLKVTAQIGNSEWKTAIWFDVKTDAYLLPIKADIHKKEQIIMNQTVKMTLWI